MGLEMWAYATSEPIGAPVDFKLKGHEEIHYWWKHHNLHGWMKDLYYEKGGGDYAFNCATLQLTAEDIDELEAAIKTKALPDIVGFVFGESDDYIDDDLEFIAKARKAIAEGQSVVYTSWW